VFRPRLFTQTGATFLAEPLVQLRAILIDQFFDEFVTKVPAAAGRTRAGYNSGGGRHRHTSTRGVVGVGEFAMGSPQFIGRPRIVVGLNISQPVIGSHLFKAALRHHRGERIHQLVGEHSEKPFHTASRRCDRDVIDVIAGMWSSLRRGRNASMAASRSASVMRHLR